MQIKLIRLSGIWIKDGSPTHKMVLAVFMHLLLIEVYAILHIVLFAIQFKNLNVDEIFEIFSTIPMDLSTCILSFVLIYKKHQIWALLASLEELTEEESWIERQKGTKIKAKVVRIKRLVKIVFPIGMTFMTLSVISALLTHKLPLHMWFPIDHQENEIVYWLLMFYQVFLLLTSIIPIPFLIDLFPMSLTCYFTGIIEELSERIKLIGSEDDDNTKPLHQKQEENLKELLKCIEIQKRIKNGITEFGSIFEINFVLQRFVSTLILCATTYSIVVRLIH